MRRAGRALAVLALAVVPASGPAWGQASPVTVSLQPNGPTVGDPVFATVTVRVPAGDLADDPRFPVWGKTWGEAEIVKVGAPVQEPARDGFAIWEQRLTLAAFRTGQVPLPPKAIAIPRAGGTVQATTPAGLALSVRSVIPQGDTQPKPKPAAAMQALPLGTRFWWTVAVLGALTAAGVWLLILQNRRRKAADPARPALAPFEELSAEIDALCAEGSMVALHTRLSFALRRYLGRRLPFPALESTTSEVQRQLLGRRMPAPLARQTVEVLRACDLVKFARQEVAGSQARERAETARRLAGELESQLAPPPPAEPATLRRAG